MSEERNQHEGGEAIDPQLHQETTILKEEIKALEKEVEILDEIIDLEEWAKADRKPRRAKGYRIRIDKEYKVVEVHSMTGRQILALVVKTPET